MSENPFRDQPLMQTRCPNVFFLLQTNPVTNPFDKAALSEKRKFELKLPYGEQQGTGQRRKKRKDSKSYGYLHSRVGQAWLKRARQCCAISRAARQRQ
ncbi:hypothetical protein BV916_21735 [Pectobacterium odoriferum]|nr:hypothetical protein BV916_21735 [Pectobacterium odoriferum]